MGKLMRLLKGHEKSKPEDLALVAQDRYQRLISFNGLDKDALAEIRQLANVLTMDVFDPKDELGKSEAFQLTGEMQMYRQNIIDEVVKLLMKRRG